MAAALPEFISPMLAAIGRPFDSAEHLFEIKWDGTRALSYCQDSDYRLLSRKNKDLRPGYPELNFLAALPAGTVLDGEIIVLQQGVPDFRGLLSREQAQSQQRVRTLMRDLPATYVVFDLLYRDFRSLMECPLVERREQLREISSACGNPKLVMSEGVTGDGLAYFEQVRGQDLEGVMAKRLDSLYRPGKRTDAWLKIKAVKHLHCAIIGFVPDGARDLKSVIIAIEEEGVLTCVGRVGSGLGEQMRGRLRDLLFDRLRDTPVIECGIAGKWVEPGIYCTVSYLERTGTGQLRAPVFLDLITE